ncbi:TPA: hypothetical protein F7Z80_09725 [Legionella pneumophila]|nr:hypothetical protein AXF35_01585 [Legionella pneumophila subsp. pascullei]HAT6916632.1 hypothetical protein [Legionella pneumophila]HAT6920603.1 hypothetical protein [Legionella pneumophila]HAT6971715.1 hypothetical protein [Legionella pneumophila]HAU3862065.1 hypothetical protein [Legionella pneumophila]
MPKQIKSSSVSKKENEILMMQRLVWNFEFSSEQTTPLTSLGHDVQDSLKWEKRYFWPTEQIIRLNTIDSSLLDLANYQKKHKEDYYYLLPDSDCNIKRRRNELLYKPVIKQSGSTLGFGPKIHLEKSQSLTCHGDIEHMNLQELLNKIKEKGIVVFVKKEAFVFKFPTIPTVKLELARLEVKNKVYFSACVEGRSLTLVETISVLLFGAQSSSEYVTFLKKTLKI